MYYINDSIASITTKWLSEVGVKLKNRENSKFINRNKTVVQIYWTHVCSVRPPAGAADLCLQIKGISYEDPPKLVPCENVLL